MGSWVQRILIGGLVIYAVFVIAPTVLAVLLFLAPIAFFTDSNQFYK